MLTLEQRAAKHFPNNPSYQAAWLRIVALMGTRWLLHPNSTYTKS